MFAHSLRSFALGALFARALPPYDLVFRFALYNLSGGICPLKSPIACTITFLQFARTIAFSISLVPSLFPIRLSNRFVPKNVSIKLCWYPHAKKLFQKCAKCAGTPMLRNCSKNVQSVLVPLC